MIHNCIKYLNKLCLEIPERPVGSNGNRQATRFFRDIVTSFGWEVDTTLFDAMDWKENGATLTVENQNYQVIPSPYSIGCDIYGELIAAGTLQELEDLDCSDKILLLYGELTREQLMPKNFVFYNPEHHQRIIFLLEQKRPAAILSATSRNAALAGGIYPFPLIEDGDFEIPSVYLTDEEGQKLISMVGRKALLVSRCMRVPGIGYNLIGRLGKNDRKRIVITAHIDAKKGTPGAIDNTTGVIILMLLAELLQDYSGQTMIELVAFNGEDYYAAPGQMIYLDQNQDRFGEILLNINIDGAGYFQGLSAFSLFDLKDDMRSQVLDVIAAFEGITEGPQWVQGDHSIFIQQGVPAIAVSSLWFIRNIDQQEITHTPKDHPGIVDCQKVVEIAEAIHLLIRNETE
jgi:aminopeptidase YwaD